MPDWLYDFCINISVLAGGVLSVLLLLALAIIAIVEGYDFFADRKKSKNVEDPYDAEEY